jgi:hypothetical protein
MDNSSDSDRCPSSIWGNLHQPRGKNIGICSDVVALCVFRPQKGELLGRGATGGHLLRFVSLIWADARNRVDDSV